MAIAPNFAMVRAGSVHFPGLCTFYVMMGKEIALSSIPTLVFVLLISGLAPAV